MTTPFSATTRVTGAGPVVTVHGEVDMATAPRLRAEIGALALGRGRLLVVDLAGVTFCDSSGISGIASARFVRSPWPFRVARKCLFPASPPSNIRAGLPKCAAKTASW